MKPFHARLHPYILRAGSWEDQGTHLKFSDGRCQPRGVEAVLTEQTQVPVELQDVSGVVLKLLLPGQEDVSHLLVAFPAVKERGTGPPRTQPCGPHDSEDLHCIPGGGPWGDPPAAGKGPDTPVSLLSRPSDGDTALRVCVCGLPASSSIPLGNGVGVGARGGSPLCQPLLQLLQDPLVKVADGRELTQATSQLLPGHWVLALVVRLIQGPHDRFVEILKPGEACY